MKVRKSHILTATKGDDRPSNVLFFDTETSQTPGKKNTKIHQLKLGVAIHTRTSRGDRLKTQSELIFFRKSEFWAYAQEKARPKCPLYLVAHNLIFDLVVVDAFMCLQSAGWDLESFYTKGMVSIFRWTLGDRTILGVDNSNLFSGTLASWGTIAGVPKMSVDFDTVSDADLIPYCHRDVEIMVALWRMWLGFLDTHKCGTFKPTVGSTAFNTWRHRFMSARVHIHNHPLGLQLERESYRGGRVEALYKGSLTQGPYYYLDVNSMYAHMLRRYSYPAGIYSAKETDSLSMMLRKLEKHAVIARVVIETPEPWFPVIRDGFTCYPVGRFQTTLTTPELIMSSKEVGCGASVPSPGTGRGGCLASTSITFTVSAASIRMPVISDTPGFAS